MAGVALGAMDLHFAWHVWHLATYTFTLRSRRGTWPVDAVVAAAIGVAGVTLRGRRGTWRHGPSLCVAGVALGDMDLLSPCMAGVALGDIDLHFARQALHFRAMDLHFAWQVWHLET